MDLACKPNWEETKQNFTRWWNHEGLVLGMFGGIMSDEIPLEAMLTLLNYQPARDNAERYTDTISRVKRNHEDMIRRVYPADIIPIADTEIGAGSLATFLGCEPDFREDTVWALPCLQNMKAEDIPSIKFDPSNKWWQVYEKTLQDSLTMGNGKYIQGFPDMYGGIDILGLMRGVDNLFLDMIDRPEWVLEKTEEVDEALFDVSTRIYDMIKLEDGSSAEIAFRLCAPGKTLHVQCDLSAMISPKMFEQFALPFLKRQCQWFDFTMFHLDGPDCIKHLDILLEIERTGCN